MKTEMEKKKKEDNDVLYLLEKKKKKKQTTIIHLHAPRHVKENTVVHRGRQWMVRFDRKVT
jgi:hypothetical protein